MTREEFTDWAEFFKRWPFDDLHRHHRPAALVAASFGGGDVRARLDWLQPPHAEVNETGKSEADMNTLKAFGIMKG